MKSPGKGCYCENFINAVKYTKQEYIPTLNIKIYIITSISKKNFRNYIKSILIVVFKKLKRYLEI